MRTRPPASLRSERGTVLILTAISLLVLMGFLTFVVDSGVMWLARVQAQNAADAGALAGAVGLAYDDFAPDVGTKAYESARLAAEANQVWRATPTSVVTFTCPALMAGRCVRVDVYRNGQRGSTPLPTIFGPLLGLAQQGVRATATARVAIANTTDCMRPFSVADKWIEKSSPPNLEFNRYQMNGPNKGQVLSPLAEADVYNPPTDSDPGSGYRVPADVGAFTVLKIGNPQSPSDPITGGWYMPVRLPDGVGGWNNGQDKVGDAIRECIGVPVSVGQYLPVESGATPEPTTRAVDDLVAQDPGATFNTTTKTVEGSCAPTCAPFSPRIIPVSIFDIDDFQSHNATNTWSHCPMGAKCLKVVNILGYFVKRTVSHDVEGYLVRYPGTFRMGTPSVGSDSSFLVNIQLVR